MSSSPARHSPTSSTHSNASATSRQGSSIRRTRDGCLICRVRRKKCDGGRGANGGCDECSRLNVVCLGYSERRPLWMQSPELFEAFKAELKQWTLIRSNARAQQPLDLSYYMADSAVDYMRASRSPSDDGILLKPVEDLYSPTHSPHSDSHGSSPVHATSVPVFGDEAYFNMYAGGHIPSPTPQSFHAPILNAPHHDRYSPTQSEPSMGYNPQYTAYPNPSPSQFPPTQPQGFAFQDNETAGEYLQQYFHDPNTYSAGGYSYPDYPRYPDYPHQSHH